MWQFLRRCPINKLLNHRKEAAFSCFVKCLSFDISNKYCKNHRSGKRNLATDSSSSDGALYKRPVRGEPGKVKHGLIPIEWFEFFMPKTGVSGFYTFAFTTFTYMISKEILVMEHNFYNGLSVLVICIALTKKYGVKAAEQLDKLIDKYEKEVSQSRIDQKKLLEDSITHEKESQWSFEGQTLLIDAKRENVQLQLEAEYRKRLIHVYDEVKKRLDCQIELGSVEGKYVHKNIVSYVVNEVHKSLTPEFLNKYMEKCIEDMEALAKQSK